MRKQTETANINILTLTLFDTILTNISALFGVSGSKITGEDRLFVILSKSRFKLKSSIQTFIFLKIQTQISRQRKKIFEFRKKHLVRLIVFYQETNNHFEGGPRIHT